MRTYNVYNVNTIYWPLLTQCWFNSYSAGIDFSAGILTSNVGLRTEAIEIFIMAVEP